MAGFDPSTPSIARVYDYLLGGKDHFPADRAMAEQLLALLPEVADALRDNKAFLTRAVTWVANQGIGQFIDLGCGMPTPPATYDTAAAVSTGARVVCVDDDPVVLSHLNAAYVKEPAVAVVCGDVRDVPAITAAVSGHLDLSAPACLMMGALLHFFPVEQSRDLVRRYLAVLAPGSCLVLSVARAASDAAEEARRSYSASGTQIHPYTAQQIAALFDQPALELVPPGVVEARRWRADWGDIPAPANRGGDIMVGVALLAAPRPGPALAGT